MDLRICRDRCSIFARPRKFMKCSEGYFLVLDRDGANSGCECGGWIRISNETAKAFDQKNKGRKNSCWYHIEEKNGDGYYEYMGGDPTMSLHTMSLDGESGCPYLVEHTISDCHHFDRLDKWKNAERKRKCLENKQIV